MKIFSFVVIWLFISIVYFVSRSGKPEPQGIRKYIDFIIQLPFYSVAWVIGQIYSRWG